MTAPERTIWIAAAGAYEQWSPFAAYASLELLIGANPGDWKWRSYEDERGPSLEGPVDALEFEVVTDGPLGRVTRLVTLPKMTPFPRSPSDWVESECNPDGSSR